MPTVTWSQECTQCKGTGLFHRLGRADQQPSQHRSSLQDLQRHRRGKDRTHLPDLHRPEAKRRHPTGLPDKPGYPLHPRHRRRSRFRRMGPGTGQRQAPGHRDQAGSLPGLVVPERPAQPHARMARVRQQHSLHKVPAVRLQGQLLGPVGRGTPGSRSLLTSDPRPYSFSKPKARTPNT